MIQFEYKEKTGLIELHNSSKIPLKDKVSLNQTVVQEFDEAGARIIYANISADLETVKKSIDNFKVTMDAEQVKIDMAKKNLKHLKKTKKQLESVMKSANYDLAEPKEESKEEKVDESK